MNFLKAPGTELAGKQEEEGEVIEKKKEIALSAFIAQKQVGVSITASLICLLKRTKNTAYQFAENSINPEDFHMVENVQRLKTPTLYKVVTIETKTNFNIKLSETLTNQNQ